MFIAHFQTKFCMRNFSNSSVIINKMKAKIRFRTASMLFVYSLKKVL